MDVLFVIGMLMVMPVNRRPPERPTLDRRISQDRKNELPAARSVKGAMRKVPVIKPGNRKHPDPIEKERRAYRRPTPAD
jgi:hypothetical protein